MNKDKKKDIVSVTDHIKEFSIEEEILGDYFKASIRRETTIALVWHAKVNKDFLNKYPNIRAIVRYGVGYDAIDLKSCKEKGVIVVNTPDYGVDEVSDTALAMILSLTRRLNIFQFNALANNAYWLGKEIPFKVKRLNEMSLGIIGFGRIGSSIAQKFIPFSRKVSFYDPYIKNGIEKVFNVSRIENLNELLEQSDIISINTPLTEETKGIINEDFINRLKRGSYLINTSRGKLVEDQKHILEGIRSGILEGYATDVWKEEPPSENDIFLQELKNDPQLYNKVIITPHTAYFSDAALKEARIKASKSCLNIIKNKYISNRIV